ncbi:MAG: hypothetical protein ACRD07_08860 [Acidimicrobiales bacterium]
MDGHQLAAGVARQVGDLQLTVRAELAGAGPSHLRYEADRRSNELTLRLLRQGRPADAVLSEEAVDDPSRLFSARVWIVDPPPGTR